jgi:hypothetical protein
MANPRHLWYTGGLRFRLVLPKHFSTATQVLERQSIATHIALLDKKVVLKRKIYIFIYY